MKIKWKKSINKELNLGLGSLRNLSSINFEDIPKTVKELEESVDLYSLLYDTYVKMESIVGLTQYKEPGELRYTYISERDAVVPLNPFTLAWFKAIQRAANEAAMHQKTVSKIQVTGILDNATFKAVDAALVGLGLLKLRVSTVVGLAARVRGTTESICNMIGKSPIPVIETLVNDFILSGDSEKYGESGTWPASTEDKKSFFKTPLGIAVLGGVAALVYFKFIK